MKDYYYILGVSEEAGINEIKNAYRKLSLKFHPDKNNGEKYFEARFKEVQEAYDILSINDKRVLYNVKLKNYKNSSNKQNSEEELKRKYDDELKKRAEKIRFEFEEREENLKNKYEEKAHNSQQKTKINIPERKNNILIITASFAIISIITTCYVIYSISKEKAISNSINSPIFTDTIKSKPTGIIMTHDTAGIHPAHIDTLNIVNGNTIEKIISENANSQQINKIKKLQLLNFRTIYDSNFNPTVSCEVKNDYDMTVISIRVFAYFGVGDPVKIFLEQKGNFEENNMFSYVIPVDILSGDSKIFTFQPNRNLNQCTRVFISDVILSNGQRIYNDPISMDDILESVDRLAPKKFY